MHADRQSIRRPVQRQGCSRLAGGIEGRGKGRVGEHPAGTEAIVHIVLGLVIEAADFRWRLRKRGGEKHVVALKKRRHLAAVCMHLVDGLEVVAAADRAGIGDGSARDAFNFAIRQRTPALADGAPDGKGRSACDDLRPRSHHPQRVGLGSAASTWCPRLSSSRAVSSTARRHSGWIGSPVRLVVAKAMRRPGFQHCRASRNVPRSGGADIGRTEVRAVGGVEQHGGVAHRSRQEPVDGHACPAFADIGSIGQPRAGGLEAEQSA